MKLNRDVLVTSLGMLKPALRTGGPVAELGYVWFDGAFARTYDGTLGISVGMQTDFSLGAPGQALMGLLGSYHGADVDLSADKPVTALSVKLGRSNAKLAALADDRLVWPFSGKGPAKSQTIALNDAWLDALARALMVRQPKHANRVEHVGVGVFPNPDGGTDICATDSMVIVCAHVDTDWQWEKTVLPRAFAEQVMKQLKDGATLSLLKDYLQAEGDDVLLYSGLVNSTDLEDLPAHTAKYLADQKKRVPLPEGFESTLQRAMFMSGSNEDPLVTIAIDDGVVTVEGSYKQGRLVEKMTTKAKKVSAPALTVEANRVYPLLLGITELSLSDKVLALYGDGVAYVVASKGQ